MFGWLNFLVEPLLQYEFMRLALVTSVVVGSLCSLLSCFLLVKRWALLGDAVSHAVLPGVAWAYALNWPYFVGALVTGLLSAVGIGYIQQHSRLKEDAAIGVVFTAAFALGIVMMGTVRGQVNLYNILFGNILTVTEADCRLAAAVGLGVVAVIALLYRTIIFWTFDPTGAQVAGVPVKALHYLMILLLTTTIVVSLHTVGIIMVIAMLITPGATGYLLTHRMPHMIGLALLCGNLSAVTGLYLSYYFNLATGAVMVLVATALFVPALLFSPSQGVIWRLLQK